jgi:16S rRNA (uracil1498-N3)-methyltransferase
MTVHRFVVEAKGVRDDRLVLGPEEAHHARRVLRLDVGSSVICFDGAGAAWSGRIAELGSRHGVVDELIALPFERAPRPEVTLAIGVLKGDRMDLVVQKATELGVARIVPLDCDRVDARGDYTKRAERWRRIALEAAKQCERNRVPAILQAMTPRAAIESERVPVLALVERSEVPLREVLTRLEGEARLIVMIGPEGGWSSDERALLDRESALVASLGSRILRAETAAIAALAIVDFALAGEAK